MRVYRRIKHWWNHEDTEQRFLVTAAFFIILAFRMAH